jgi:hypothetical protein
MDCTMLPITDEERRTLEDLVQRAREEAAREARGQLGTPSKLRVLHDLTYKLSRAT